MSVPSWFHPRSISRWARYGLYAVLIILLWQFVNDFTFVRVQDGDDSVVGVSGHRSLVVKRFDPGSPGPQRGDVVVFLMQDQAGNPCRRVARVAGVAGDRVAAEGRYLTVNGQATVFRASEARLVEGRVPDGMFLLLNDNPFSSFPDSRRTGLIPREVIVGRFLTESPF